MTEASILPKAVRVLDAIGFSTTVGSKHLLRAGFDLIGPILLAKTGSFHEEKGAWRSLKLRPSPSTKWTAGFGQPSRRIALQSGKHLKCRTRLSLCLGKAAWPVGDMYFRHYRRLSPRTYIQICPSAKSLILTKIHGRRMIQSGRTPL